MKFLPAAQEVGDEDRRETETCRRAGALHVIVRQDTFASKVLAGLGKSGFYTHFEGSQVKSESDSMEL